MAGPSSATVVLLLQLLVVVVVASVQAQGKQQGRLLLAEESPKPSYKSIWDAAVGESWMMKQLYGKNSSEYKTWIDLDAYTSSKELRQLKTMAENSNSLATVFIPGRGEDVYKEFAEYNCLTLEEWFREIAKNTDRVLPYIESFVVRDRARNSSDFQDGMNLTTMLRKDGTPVNLTLRKSKASDGSTEWLLKGASWKRIGGSGVKYDDVVIRPSLMNIPAGKAIVHIIDTVVRVDSEENFWAEKRKEKLSAAGLPDNAQQCPSNGSKQDNGTLANAMRASGPPPTVADATQASGPPPSVQDNKPVAIGVAVGVGVPLVLCAVLLSMLLMGKGPCFGGHRERRGSTSALLPETQDKYPTAHPAPDIPQSCIGKDQDLASSSHTAPRPTHPPSGSDVGVYVKAGSSSSTVNSSAGMQRSNDSMTPFAFGLQQGSLPFSDSSPFANFAMDARDLSINLGMISDGRPPSDAVGSTAANVGTSNGRYSAARTPRSSRSASQSTSNSGSNQQQASEESGRDGLQPLAATHPRGIIPSPAFNSYEGGLLPIESMPMGRIPHALVVPFEELSLEEVIGAGAEGKVYRGTWKHTDIAAKEYLAPVPSGQLNDSARASAQAALAKEVYILTRLNHPNLVRFCAVCLERSLMVMEYYKNGSVFDIIRRAEREMWDMDGSPHSGAKQFCQYLSWDTRLKMLHDVAAGMCYLHARDHIHGDLRSPNLFVGTDDKVKIGDFGFTKRLTRDAASVGVARITHPRWVAPELMMNYTLSRATDVYSFGIIMYELLTFRVPFELLRKEQVVVEVMRGGRPAVPPEDMLPEGTSSHSCLQMYIRLMDDCWAQDAGQRPSFEEIARRLKAMQRWRKLKARMEHVGETARRVRSMPVMRISNDGTPRRSTAGTATDSFDEPLSRTHGARRIVSEPVGQRPAAAAAAAQQQEPELQRQQPSQLAARLRAELLLPVPAPEWEPPRLSKLPPMPSLRHGKGFSSIPEVEGEGGGMDIQFASQPSVGPPHHLTETMSSLVSSTVVQGNLAIIPTGPGVAEQEALAGIQDPGQLAAAHRVLLVASDLPSMYTRAHEYALRARRSREKDPYRENVHSE